jgi:hypothetical protein
LVRVLKPGGDLYCSVPFLQPFHGYPQHYYNMTHQGLVNLFAHEVEIVRIDVPRWMLPVYALTWIVRSWADGLGGAARQAFLDLRLEDLLRRPETFLGEPFVTELPAAKNRELACGTLLVARKPP